MRANPLLAARSLRNCPPHPTLSPREERGERAFLATLLRAMQPFLGHSDLMAYLSMMAVRLIELHRVLKPTGSLHLHCDPTARHCPKLLSDAVF